MKNTHLLLPILCLFATSLFAQNEADRTRIISQTNIEALQAMATRASLAFEAAMRDPSITKELVYSNGQIAHLTGVDRNGTLIYSSDDNKSAALSSKINRIQTGGTSGFDLDGAYVEIGVWESMLPLITHQELLGKVTYGEFSSAGGHATHTATTMIGSGVNALAKGMAPAATILSFTSSNDEPEIIAFAAAGGILSNHSYSSGNPGTNTPGYGVYTPYAAEWDEILYNAPYLCIVKSASNSRNDGVNVGDGGYDIIFGSGGSKNTLTIGAVDDVLVYTGPASVTQSDFSNWGPTDDWRIKPDITANGVSLWSGDVDHDADYSSRSGTSMSTPVVSGTVALLQQFYRDNKQFYMKAATVKALLIASTDEAGDHDGPDFQSGWGLLNAERAAEIIANDGNVSMIKELSIASGSAYSMEIEVDGTGSLELAIAWTDPPGTPLVNGGLDNPTEMLVNDLDVKISGSGNEFLPWTFTPNANLNNFTDAATKGDNFRDNVERIDIGNLAAGLYTVSVTHKGALFSGKQDFSMVINGLKQLPTSGLVDANGQFSYVVYPVPSLDGSLNIRIPAEHAASQYLVQITDIHGRLLSSKTFSDKEISLNVSNLSAGTYFISIQTDKGRYSEQVLIGQ